MENVQQNYIGGAWVPAGATAPNVNPSNLNDVIAKGGSERWTVFNWFAARDDVKKRMAELEERISSLRDALRAAERPVESTKTQRILVIREQELDRARSTRSSSTTKSPRSRRKCVAGD
jgi:hypothetical protein